MLEWLIVIVSLPPWFVVKLPPVDKSVPAVRVIVAFSISSVTANVPVLGPVNSH